MRENLFLVCSVLHALIYSISTSGMFSVHKSISPPFTGYLRVRGLSLFAGKPLPGLEVISFYSKLGPLFETARAVARERPCQGTLARSLGNPSSSHIFFAPSMYSFAGKAIGG